MAYSFKPSDSCRQNYYFLNIKILQSGVFPEEIEARKEAIITHIVHGIKTQGVKKLPIKQQFDDYRVSFFGNNMKVKHRNDIEEIRILQIYAA